MISGNVLIWTTHPWVNKSEVAGLFSAFTIGCLVVDQSAISRSTIFKLSMNPQHFHDAIDATSLSNEEKGKLHGRIIEKQLDTNNLYAGMSEDTWRALLPGRC